jgi:hypothetical protein
MIYYMHASKLAPGTEELIAGVVVELSSPLDRAAR